MVERIEVIRGPAAARYGSWCRRWGGEYHHQTPLPRLVRFAVALCTNQPESSKEGDTRRGNLALAARWLVIR